MSKIVSDDNIEQLLNTIGKEVKGLSKDEFTKEENTYYENLYKIWFDSNFKDL